MLLKKEYSLNLKTDRMGKRVVTEMMMVDILQLYYQNLVSVIK